MDEQAIAPTTLSVEEDFDQEDTLMNEYQARQDRLTKLALSDAFEEVEKILNDNIETLERGQVIENPLSATDDSVGQAYKACLLAAGFVKNIRDQIKTAGEVHVKAGQRE